MTDIGKLIGNTPLLLIAGKPGSAEIYIKLESLNPGGSVKDRVAQAMVQDALGRKLIKKDTIIIEATSGNTGIGLALVTASQGIPLALAMPDSMSRERIKLLKAYGAQLILTPGSKGMPGAIRRVRELLATDSRYLHLDQFSNPANPRIHFETTGPEIFYRLEGHLDAFVAGVGSGGTLTGVGKFLKSPLPKIRIVAVEPAASPVLAGGLAGPHCIQGLGAGFIPEVLDTRLIDSIIPVRKEQAFETARWLARNEGILSGISGGAAVWAAQQIAAKLGPGKRVVTLVPDSGERYLSTSLYSSEEDKQ